MKAAQEFIWRQTSAGKKNHQKLERLRGIYKGKRCFVMGNGPSLKQIDLSLLKNEVTIGSNGIFLIKEEMGYLPTFLTVEDHLVAEDRANRLNQIRDTIKIFPYDLSYCLKIDDSTIYANFVRQYDGCPKFSSDFARIVYWGGTVTFMNMQLAYYLGCNEIYLIGLDHNYKVTDKVVDTVITSQQDDVNHIHPDYFGKGFRWHDPKVDRMEQAYVVARKFFEQNGVKVFNATVGGKLEVFQRSNLGNLFS
jgi:hypothetical protein